LVKLYTKYLAKSSNPWGVIAMSTFDITCCAHSRIIFIKFELGHSSRFGLIAFYCWYVTSCCDLDLWLLNLKRL